MKRTLFIILGVVAVFLVIGIAFTNMAMQRAPSQDSYLVSPGFGGSGGGAPESVAPPVMQEPASAPAYDSAADANRSTVGNGIAPASQDRLVIQNADLALVVKDPKARMAEISKLATDMGGYVVSSNIYETFASAGKQVPEATVVIR